MLSAVKKKKPTLDVDKIFLHSTSTQYNLIAISGSLISWIIPPTAHKECICAAEKLCDLCVCALICVCQIADDLNIREKVD